jgi:hypothetical protein
MRIGWLFILKRRQCVMLVCVCLCVCAYLHALFLGESIGNRDLPLSWPTADASTVYITGKSFLYNCRAKNGGGVALKTSAIFMRDFANLTQCRARENGGGIMTYGVCDVSLSGPVRSELQPLCLSRLIRTLFSEK